eukprot:TRINITY_DN277_c1_g2_i1.p2 TRINITY_DN277_c1_g2~~TRINITY_DN277_c1_g2_i1.p2  ORF type:complete len:1761 (-),score=195.95 TRINITY_DN277_c1_g2_i1:3742-9024(-)
MHFTYYANDVMKYVYALLNDNNAWSPSSKLKDNKQIEKKTNMLDRKKKNILHRGLSHLREALFKVISQSLENNIVNIGMFLIAILIEVLQITPFFLSIGLRVADKNPITLPRFEPMLTAVMTATGTTAVLNMSFTQLMSSSFGFLSVYLVLLFIMIYAQSKCDDKKVDTRAYKFASCLYKTVSFMLVIISLFGSWPIFIMQILPYYCNYKDGTALLENDPTVVCWEGLHLAVSITNGINIVLFMIFLGISEALFTDTSPRSKVPWACTQANNMKLLKHLSKFTLACFTVFDPMANYYNYLFVLEVLIHSLIIYIIFMSPSYINRIAGRTILFFESYLLFTIVGMYIYRLTDIVILIVGFFMLNALLLVMSSLVVFSKCKYDQYILSVHVTDNKNESFKEYYFYELFRLLDLYTTEDPGVVIHLYGIYSNHQAICNNPACNCASGLINKNLNAQKKREEIEGERGGRTPGFDLQYEGLASSSRSNMASMFQIAMSKSLDDMQRSEDRQLENKEEEKDSQTENYELLIDMCTSLIDSEVTNNLGSVTLRMISAYYSREYIGNIFKTVYELIFIEEKQKPSFRDRFLIYKYKKVIEEEMATVAKKGLADNGMDVERLIEFEKHYETFRAQAETASNIVNRFWEQLKSKDLDVNGLYEIGSKVGSIYQEMQNNYNAAIAIFPHNFKLVNEFGNFEKSIMNNDMIAKNYEIRARQIFKEQAEQNREGVHNYEDNLVDVNSTHHTCICVVSGNPNTMGDIVSVNNEITQNLGFKAKEVIGQNCGVLCPQYISSKHNQMIENFIKRGDSNFLKNRRIVTACHSKGFLVLLEVYVKVLPSVEEGIRFVGIFKTLEDYGEFFKEKGNACVAQDFAFIVTSQEGQILGISETCMTRLGVPVSLFKPKGGAEDAIMINTLIKEINETETEEMLLSEGKKLTLDTKVLQFSINKENLSKKEIKALETRAGKYKVFVKLNNESYGQGLVQVKIYKMIISSQEAPIDRATLGLELVENRKTIASVLETPESRYADTKQKYRPGAKRRDLDKEDLKTIVLEDEASRISSINLKGLNDFKQTMNVKSAAINVSAIKGWINIMFLIMILLASAEFGLLITDQKEYVKSLEIVFITNRRIIDIGLLHSDVISMVSMAKDSDTPTWVHGVNLYEYLREYGYRSIGALGKEQDYMNTLDFSYTDTLISLEQSASVPVLTLGMNGQQSITSFTINTAITQYNARAADFMSYSFDDLRKAITSAGTGSPINSQYFFIKENGIGDLTTVAQRSEQEFRKYLKTRMGQYLPYFVGAAILIAVSLTLCFGILVPKLVGIQREKINVLMLYTQMNRREVDIQMAKCLEYQKSNGFWDYSDENDEEASKDSISVSEDSPEKLRTTDKRMASEDKQEESLEESEEESDSSSENSESPSESNSDEDSEEQPKEEKPKDENEITIQEQLNSEQLRAKLTTNKCSLITLVVLVGLLYCCYFVVGAVKHIYDMRKAEDSLEFVGGVSKMLKSPLYLLLYSLISVKESRNIYVNGEESVEHYLEEFLESNAFKQTLASGSDEYLKNTQKLFDKLDSPSLCPTLMKLYQLIQENYPEQPGIYTYSAQENITQSVCEEYQDQLLTRGLTQAAFMIHQEVKKLQAERFMTMRSANITATENALAMLQMFLAPIYEGLLLDLKQNISNDLGTLKQFLILFYVFYLLISFVVHLLFWTCFLKAMEAELIKSRGMLKIMPLELIDKLKKMKKEKANLQSINFFKAFEKIQPPIISCYTC